jgi:hypothetical protein
MDAVNTPPPTEGPSRAALINASALALAAATTVLLVAVLPAEYGVDPLGTGKALGLSAISQADTAAVEGPPIATDAGLVPTVLAHKAAAYYPAEYKFDSREITLQPYDYLEYKYHLQMGAQMLFSWKASAAVVQEFHGEPDDGPEGYFESYDKATRQGADGTLTAPYAGIHGWYWENTGGDPVTIRLTTAGFYDGALEISSTKKRRSHQLRALETLTRDRN